MSSMSWWNCSACSSLTLPKFLGKKSRLLCKKAYHPPQIFELAFQTKYGMFIVRVFPFVVILALKLESDIIFRISGPTETFFFSLDFDKWGFFHANIKHSPSSSKALINYLIKPNFLKMFFLSGVEVVFTSHCYLDQYWSLFRLFRPQIKHENFANPFCCSK